MKPLVEIEFEMPVPSKKNNKRAHGRKVVSSQDFYNYQDMMVEIIDWRDDPIEEPVGLFLDIVVGDRRRRDDDNMETSIRDILVVAGVLKDDSVFNISDTHKRSRYRKGEWKCNVILTSATDWVPFIIKTLT